MSYNMNHIIPKHDIIMVVFDALRYDVAQKAFLEGRLPNLSKYLPESGWEKRHAPGTFTYPSHQAMFAGFLPTPADHPKAERLFAAAFPGSETSSPNSYAFVASNMVTGLQQAGYYTLCIGGVGFFNQKTALSQVLPAYFQRCYWAKETGVTAPDSTEQQFVVAQQLLKDIPTGQRLFLCLNLSVIHQPNYFYQPGRTQAEGDDLDSHQAALEYIDGHWDTFMNALQPRGPAFHIYTSDHGTAYNEDGYTGHRFSHPKVLEVPYTEFIVCNKISNNYSRVLPI